VLTALLWALIGIGAVYAGWLAWRDATIADIPNDLDPLPLLASLIMRIVATLLTVTVWLGLYRGLGGVIGVQDGFRIYLLTNLGKYLPGKVLHVAGRVALLRDRGEPASTGVTSILLELMVSMLAAALVSVTSLPLLLQNQGLAQYATLVGGLAILAVPLGLAVLHPRVLGVLLQMVARWMPTAGGQLSTRLPSYRSILGLLAIYTLVWICGSIGLFAAAQSVYPLDGAWLPAMGGIAAASYVAGLAVPFAPAGIGAREGLMTLLLSTMMPAPAAAVTSVLYRLMSILAELISAGLTVAFGAVRGSMTQRASRAPDGERSHPTMGGISP
jgi:glycosyltransferase 2 family protein